ncbi:MAG: hypothetical protein FWC06_04490 [Treponema sp.]|nr:hypothetical protein [Treponema sp.]
MRINFDKLRTPQFILLIYVVVSSLLIIAFRFIFPGSEVPLPVYSKNWRLIQGALEVFSLFPALAFSALVIPFGLASYEETYSSFSDMFFKRFISFVATAIIAAVVYGIIFFLALPILSRYEENMRFSGALYHLAKKNAQDSADSGEWFESSQFVAICDRIWLNSPELESLREKIVINMDEQSFEERGLAKSAITRGMQTFETLSLSDNVHSVDATQAINMSIAAFNEERYFDAHWLANLGERLSVSGSAQAASASRLSSEAWNMIESLSPNQNEIRLFELFNLKVSGYQAMETGDWIRAFYIFQRLMSLNPGDPDVKNFLAASEQGAKRTAFFIDEMELSVGEILNGAVFSLPGGDGRSVLRFSSLTLSADVAYGFGFDYMNFDGQMNLKANGTARYVKLLPFSSNNKPQILILTHALERSNDNIFYQSEWLTGSEPAGGVLLDISFEDFLLLSKVRRGLSNLQINELFEAADRLDKAGYVSQIFQAEILNRFGTALFFLPMAIFVIVIAWRYRAKQKPRYLFILLLPVLPVVFHGFVFLYRTVFNILGIWLVISIGFSSALVIYLVTLAVTLFVSLIVLSAQHS